MAASIHPTAIVDPTAQLAEGVRIGPYAIIQAETVLGEDCHVQAGAVIGPYTSIGRRCVIHPYAVIGGEAQDLKLNPSDKPRLCVGEDCVLREYVTISRGTGPEGLTSIGNKCFFMAYSHIGHDCLIGDEVIMANGAAAAGHVEIGSKTFLSSHVVIHQFCWVGEMVMTRGNSAASQHLPPYTMLKGPNEIMGLNVVGMRRAGFSPTDRSQVREAYQIFFRGGLTNTAALAEMDKHADWAAPAVKFREFIRRVLTAKKPFNRGIPIERAVRLRSQADGDETQ
jgi:UDP-N-acetylglucosamine acyltransferase